MRCRCIILASYPVDTAAANDRLFEMSDPYQTASYFRQAGYADHIFARAAYGHDGRLWLQYWFWYFYNSYQYASIGEHEGDWEMIQLRLNAAHRPDAVTYSVHNGGESCPFNLVASAYDPDVPQVWVGDGSHASYPFSGQSDLVAGAKDQHWGDGYNVRPYAEVVTGEISNFWSWPGYWGGTYG